MSSDPSTASPGSRSPLVIPRGALQAATDHAREVYPNECCGAMIGSARDRRVKEMFALPNTTEEGPRRRFLVRPVDYGAAEALATSLGAELIGFYHSHPDHTAEPSRYDLDHAWPFFSYLIISVLDGHPAALRSWRLREDRSRFDEEPVEVAHT